MAKKIYLDHRSDPVQVTMFGIACHSRDYFLSFHLNRKLDLHLTKQDDFKGFSFFSYPDDNGFNTWLLLGNRNEEATLIPEYKQTDYILLVEGPFKKAQKDQLLAQIRSIESVMMIYELAPGSVKNPEVILNDLELHIMQINKDKKTNYSPTKI